MFVIGEAYFRWHKSMNVESLSAVGIPIFEADDLNTYKHKNLAKAKNGYGNPTPTIEINNIGLRDENLSPQTNQDNILMIGDSFTFGSGVNGDETFTEILEDKMSRIESKKGWKVWNAGHVGYSIGNYYLLLKKFAPILKPKLVVVNIFVGNDITEIRRKNWHYDRREDLIKVEDLKIFVNEQNQLESRVEKKPGSYFGHFLWQRWNVFLYKYGLKKPSETDEPTLTWPVFLEKGDIGYDPQLEFYWNQFFTVFTQIQHWSLKQDIPVLFNLIPMDVQVSDEYRSKYGRIYFDDKAFKAKRPQTRIMKVCKDTNTLCLDLLPYFQKNRKKETLYFSHNADPHLSKTGHMVTAHFLFKKIQKILQN